MLMKVPYLDKKKKYIDMCQCQNVGRACRIWLVHLNVKVQPSVSFNPLLKLKYVQCNACSLMYDITWVCVA